MVSTGQACACAFEHSACVDEDGDLWTMGNNLYGKLGIEMTTQVMPRPCRVPGLKNIVGVSCGRMFTACVDCNGSVYTFGCNYFKQLGTGSTERWHSVRRVPDLPPVLSVHCGGHHLTCLDFDSNLWGVGGNEYRQLAQPLEGKIEVPCVIATDVRMVSCGGNHTVIVDKDDDISAVGSNRLGEVGGTDIAVSSWRKIESSPLITDLITDIACGWSSTYVLSAGVVYTMGFNGKGQLGNGLPEVVHSNVLTPLESLPPIVRLYAGETHCILKDKDGEYWGFGNNSSAQLLSTPTELTKSIFTPIKISCPALKTCEEFYTGGNHCIMRCSDQMFIVGCNHASQLGIPIRDCVYPPEQLPQECSNVLRHPFTSRKKSARK